MLFIFPFLINTLLNFRYKKIFNLVFLSAVPITAASEYFLHFNMLVISLSLMLLYILFLFLTSYFKYQGHENIHKHTAEYLGILFILFIPLFASDLINNSRYAFSFYPLENTGILYFPFFLSSCGIIFAASNIKDSNKILHKSTANTIPENREKFKKLLSIREREIFDFLLAGSRNKDIATDLNIAESTVKKHAANIFSKAGVNSKLELISCDFSSASKSVPDYYQNTTEGPFKLLVNFLKLNEKTTLKELKMIKKKIIIAGISVLLAGVAVLTAVNILFINEKHKTVNLIDSLEEYNWSFEKLITENEEYENLDGFWELSTPDKEGINQDAVKVYLELCIKTGADALVIARGNKIICEWYSDRYSPPWGAMSSTKSITGLLAGIMQDQGLLNIEDSVGTYIPEWKTGIRSEVTIKHLLTMTSGLKNVRLDSGTGVGYSSDKNDYVTGLTPQVKPGTEWNYSNEGAQLLSPVLETASRTELDLFSEQYLFNPLGMDNSYLEKLNGDVLTYAEMKTTPRDFLRIGFMVMNKGMWNNEQIISREYIKEMLSPVSQFENYGYLWWLYNINSPLSGYGTEGYLDTDMYLFPEYDLLVMRMQAPEKEFTGKPESGNYQNTAWKLFPLFFKNDTEQELLNILTLFTDSNTDPVFEEALNKAVELSAAGEINSVINLLDPFIENKKGSEIQKTKALMTITLAYIRKRDYNTSEYYFNIINDKNLNFLSEYWKDHYYELKEWIDNAE